MSTATIWIVILAVGAGSWGLRFSFLGALGKRPLPEWVLRHLRYTAVAIIPGLVAPMVLTQETVDPIRLVAAGLTLAVGLYTRNIFAALATGGICFFGVVALTPV